MGLGLDGFLPVWRNEKEEKAHAYKESQEKRMREATGVTSSFSTPLWDSVTGRFRMEHKNGVVGHRVRP